jgi:hypothetical protein
VTAAPGGDRRSEWLADLEELADLAAETVAPQDLDQARQRRGGYSGERLASLLTVLPGTEEDAVAPVPGPRQPGVGRAGDRDGVAPPAPRCTLVPIWVPGPAVVPLSSSGQAVAPRPRPGQPAEVPPAHRRLIAPGLALLGAGALCAGLLLRLPGADPAAPAGGGPAYSTPSPEAGSASLQPALVQPASPEVLAPPAASAQGAAAPPAAAPPVAAPMPAAPAGTAAVTRRPLAAPPARTPSGAGPVAVPAATATAAPSPTALPATAPAATPGAAVAVRSVTLSMGTCEDRGAAWVCPETVTFDLSPGAHGTLSYHLLGTAVTCSGDSSAFDRAQPDVDIPAGTTRVTVSSALVFPAGAAPAAAAPGGAASTARAEVTAPTPVTSASETFGTASCH